MSFRDDMKKVKKEIKILDSRSIPIEEENYKKLYNYLFEIIKNDLKSKIEHKIICYEQGFFSKKNPTYASHYGIKITVFPEKIYDFAFGIKVEDVPPSLIYGRGWIHLQTAYLDDVKKSLIYLLESAKADEFDHILIDSYNSERNSYGGKELTIKEIDELILNLRKDWQENVEANYNLYSDVSFTRDIIVEIKCDLKGNII